MYQYENPSFVGAQGQWNAPSYGGIQQPYTASAAAAPAYGQRFSSPTQQSSPTGYGLESGGAPLRQEFSGLGAPGLQHLSPEEFSGTLGRLPQGAAGVSLQPLDTIFITELSRCARGLQDIGEQLEARDNETQRKGYYAATAHVFYVFGLLSAKGILIPSDLPGRGRQEGGGAASACREFGRVLDRVVDKYASRRGIVEEVSLLVERGRICYAEIARGIDSGQAWGGTAPGETEAQQKKKVA